MHPIIVVILCTLLCLHTPHTHLAHTLSLPLSYLIITFHIDRHTHTRSPESKQANTCTCAPCFHLFRLSVPPCLTRWILLFPLSPPSSLISLSLSLTLHKQLYINSLSFRRLSWRGSIGRESCQLWPLSTGSGDSTTRRRM